MDKKDIKITLIFSIIALPIGILIGLIEVVHLKGIHIVSGINASNKVLWTLLLPVAGIIIILLKKFCDRYGEDVDNGMEYLFDVVNKERKDIPVILIPFLLITNWLSLLCGASLCKEDIGVQIGATASNFIGKRFDIENTAEIFTIAGIAAGLAGIFLKPVAAICFALEVIVISEIKYYALLPSIVATFASYLTAKSFVGTGEAFVISESIEYMPMNIVKLVLLGIVFGLTGSLFIFLLHRSEEFFKELKVNIYVKTFVLALIVAIVIIIAEDGIHSGMGTELIEKAFYEPHEIKPYSFILKMIITVGCLAIGFKGGEVTPLFTIGACLGLTLSKYVGLPANFVTALGYVAVFAAGTNTFLCPIVVGAEVFGLEFLPSFAIVSSVAYLSNFNMSIYKKQKNLRG